MNEPNKLDQWIAAGKLASAVLATAQGIPATNASLFAQGYVERNAVFLRRATRDELVLTIMQLTRAAIEAAAKETFVNPEAMIAKGADWGPTLD